ncbi:hypothetical protein CER18_04520 [Bartonella tribocorum]|uniref:Uncharacterized protein n=1 Tax=Bartonella tribocorum TaxID=85701 RepID=A0A2M6USD3_9HYPH|nr:hypothetical protein CER18_04520 [Bartonella tribocorum]
MMDTGLRSFHDDGSEGYKVKVPAKNNPLKRIIPCEGSQVKAIKLVVHPHLYCIQVSSWSFHFLVLILKCCDRF